MKRLVLSQLHIDQKLPSRPAYGTFGKDIELWSNFFALNFDAKKRLFLYDIMITPDPASSRERRRLVQLYLLGQSFRDDIATDFSKFLVSPYDLEEQNPLNIASKPQVLFWETEDPPPPGSNQADRQQYSVHVSLQGEQTAALGNFLLSLRDPAAPRAPREEILQSLNIIMSYSARFKTFGLPDPEIMSVGSNRFYKIKDQASFDLKGALQAFRGYLLSVRATSGSTRMLMQVKHAASYKPGPLSNIIDEFRRDIDGTSSIKLERFLAGVKVSTHHLPEKKNKSGEVIIRMKTIFSLAEDMKNQKVKSPRFGNPRQVRFNFNNQPPVLGLQAGFISVEEYFRKKYSINVSLNYPVVNIGAQNKPQFLPVEVLKVLSGQPCMRALHPVHTAEMIRVAARKAPINAKSIAQEAQKMLQLRPTNPVLEQFGITLGPHLTKVLARVLNAPSLQYKQEKKVQNAAWNLRDVGFAKPVTIKDWSVLCIKSGQGQQDAWANDNTLVRWLNMFQQVLKNHGIQIGTPTLTRDKNPYKEITIDSRDSKSLSEIEKVFKILPKVDFMLVVASSEEKAQFNLIKKLGDCQHGVLTRQVVGKKLAKMRGDTLDPQYMSNVALKVNVGLGGVNQRLPQGHLRFISDGGTMLVGYDVGHPPDRKRTGARSVVALVASINKDAAVYYGDIAVQESGKEVSSEQFTSYRTQY